jgi:hypothetical protein
LKNVNLQGNILEILRRAVWYEYTDVSEVLAASIIREMMKVASTSETSVNVYQTARRIRAIKTAIFILAAVRT